RFTKKYGPLAQTPRDGPQWAFELDDWRSAQTRLRENWEIHAGLLAPIVEGKVVGDEIGWKAVPHSERRAIEGTKFELSPLESLTFDQTYDQITLHASNLRRYLEVTLFALPSDRLCKCKRPREEGCDTPYFVAEHLGQEYCSEACQHWGQKLAKREWWHRQ